MVQERQIRVALVAYPGAQQAALLGLRDLLEAAGGGAPGQARRFRTELVEDFSGQGQFDAVVLPPSLGARPEGAALRAVAGWVKRQHKGGALACSVCAGAFLLAAAGVLDGRPATTHWALAQDLARTYPQVQLQAERLLIDDGDVVTAGGLMAWTDLGLRLIARFMGPAVMLATARFFLIDPGVREQSYYNLFAPDLTHGDAAVLQAQHWLQPRFHQPVAVPQMAAAAGLEERTFLRRFQAATGLAPSQYLQQLRIAKAREQLELSTASIDSIAAAAGYLDVSAFRKLFQRTVGLSPSAYRKRFAPARG
ncbi:helix-turn-helix domain-containing protein [Leisingera sp. SS27]|uniref:GlxA family transcriptional regulator n=1 Tax=Leisingera sp. SS27 TaxID=2979462 RepID=UPI00232BCBE4|nr:helix-turn-helix domain-containing protein [Leisingera sp. SS27]MDC0657658.1 helix-turn-helix domain-containing protein [Leisingera sp. SS27]